MELTVVFRNMLPSEELVYLARRMTGVNERWLGKAGAIQVSISIDKSKTASPSYVVRVSADAHCLASTVVDGDPYLAVRNALLRFEANLATGQTGALPGPASALPRATYATPADAPVLGVAS